MRGYEFRSLRWWQYWDSDSTLQERKPSNSERNFNVSYMNKMEECITLSEDFLPWNSSLSELNNMEKASSAKYWLYLYLAE